MSKNRPTSSRRQDRDRRSCGACRPPAQHHLSDVRQEAAVVVIRTVVCAPEDPPAAGENRLKMLRGLRVS